MANLQQMLGAMLASGMAGRLGGGLAGKLGLTVVGHLAHRAYQDSRQDPERESRQPEESRRGGAGSLGGLLDSITGGGQSGRTAGFGALLSEGIGNVLNRSQDEPATGGAAASSTSCPG